MKTFEFKKLDIKPEGSKLTRFIKSGQFKRTLIFMALGALIGFGTFYFGKSNASGEFWSDVALKHIFLGAGLGAFISNSPCARGRC